MKGMSGKMKDPVDFTSSWADTGWDAAPQTWDTTTTDNWANSTAATIASG
jgi:hypothetical protein